MQRSWCPRSACLCTLGLLSTGAFAAPVNLRPQEFTSADMQVPDIVAVPTAAPAKALGDTVWIADWSFDDAGGGCTSAGWTQYDNRIGNGGGNPAGLDVSGHTVWTQVPDYSGQGLISGNAAKLGIHNLCWQGDGYGNNWDYGIRLNYRGNTTLDFDFKCDTESCCDYVTVVCDSGAASFARVNYATNPTRTPDEYRTQVEIVVAGVAHSVYGGNTGAGSLHGTCALIDFGAPGTTHCAYIRFASDSADSHEDGSVASAFGAALVVDNIALTGGGLDYTENFSGALDSNVTFVNMNPTTPFGMWARLYKHVTDNDKCTENTTCAWLWSDPHSIAVDPSVAYGPGSAVVHGWLDDIIVGPWVSLASTPGAAGTFLSFRRFFGNYFNWSAIAQNWSLRSLTRVPNTDSTDPTDSVDCVTPWVHSGSWSTGGAVSSWVTHIAPMSQYVAVGAREIQLRWRLSDWRYLTDGMANPYRAGPGPYIDRIRIGRGVLTGPVLDEGIDARSQAQDCFSTLPFATVAGSGEHFAPSTSRFGTGAFSMGTELTIGKMGPNVVTGDSISIGVTDVRGAGGVTLVRWYGTITTGPHAGKAPAPWTVGGNGFFAVPADSCRDNSGVVIANKYFVDLDDTYFRGGDGLVYFWAATDAGGGFTSDPVGMTSLPANRGAAEAATGGLLEVNLLPAINWAPAYLARIAADAHGDLEPTSAELAASHQARCVLYDDMVNFRRLSGDINRTAMMYTLDRLGYRGAYDVYDQSGYGKATTSSGDAPRWRKRRATRSSFRTTVVD